MSELYIYSTYMRESKRTSKQKRESEGLNRTGDRLERERDRGREREREGGIEK